MQRDFFAGECAFLINGAKFRQLWLRAACKIAPAFFNSGTAASSNSNSRVRFCRGIGFPDRLAIVVAIVFSGLILLQGLARHLLYVFR
jgi:hypothetical protein